MHVLPFLLRLSSQHLVDIARNVLDATYSYNYSKPDHAPEIAQVLLPLVHKIEEFAPRLSTRSHASKHAARRSGCRFLDTSHDHA